MSNVEIFSGDAAPIAEWDRCLGLLARTRAFLSKLGRSGIRLDVDFPEEEWADLRDRIDDYLYPEPISTPRPYERLASLRGSPNG